MTIGLSCVAVAEYIAVDLTVIVLNQERMPLLPKPPPKPGPKPDPEPGPESCGPVTPV